MSHLLAALHRAVQAPAMAGIHIKSVTIAATRDPRHDIWLTITWSFPDAGAKNIIQLDGLPGITCSSRSRPSDTVLRYPREVTSPAEIEDDILAAAWLLGAWDLVRYESAPLAEGEDWRDARYGIGVNFGRNPYSISGQALINGDQAPDFVCVCAARSGFVHWRFKPLAVSTPEMQRAWQSKDRTLAAGCRREGTPGGRRGEWRNPRAPHTVAEHVYQLGRATHENRSTSSKDRRAGYPQP